MSIPLKSVTLASFPVLLLLQSTVLAGPAQLHQHENQHPHAQQSRVANLSPLTQLAGSAEQAAVYTCSMHPHVRSENLNDRCPICGMALIPVAQDHENHSDPFSTESSATVLRLSPRAYAMLQPELTPGPPAASQGQYRLGWNTGWRSKSLKNHQCLDLWPD